MFYQVAGLYEPSNSLNFKILVEHKGETLSWQLSVLGRSVVKTETIFDDFNKLLAYMGEEKQDKIFNLLKEIHEDLSSTMIYEMIFQEVRKKTSALLTVFDFNQVLNFVNSSRDIIIPTNLNDSFMEDIAKNITRDKTYIRRDYVDLVAMVLILKSLLPVFSQYISIIQDEVGKEYKEDYVFNIISQSMYANHKSIQKLKDYISASLRNNNNKSDIDNTIKGMTEDEYLDILLARTIIRKLIVSDLSGYVDETPKVDNNHNLITYTFKFMSQIKKDSERSYNILTKPEGSSSDQDGSSLSILEEYRLNHDVIIGDIVTLEHFIRDMGPVIQRLSPNLPIELIQEFQVYVKALKHEMIYHPQIRIIQILFKKQISPMSLMYLPKDKIVELLGLASSVLWYNNLKVLALFVGATTKESQINRLASTGSRGRLDDDIAEEIEKVYPFTYISRSKKESKNKVINPVITSIDSLINDLSMGVWYSSASVERIREAYNDPHWGDNSLIIPHTIRNEIGKFFLFAQSV